MFKRLAYNNNFAAQKQHSQHLEFVCSIALPVGVAVSGAWIFIFAFIQHWPLVFIESTLCCLILTGWISALKGHVSTGMLLSQIACILFITYFSLVFDVPDASVPRVSHLYLLVIALAGFVNLQLNPTRLQAGIILGAIAGFVLFSSSPMKFPFAAPLPSDIRVFTAWAHAGIASFALCGGILLLQRKLGRESRLLRELRTGIGKDQFELFFQPQVDQSGKLIGAEALLRWKNPRLGYVGPDRFIPLAERAGLMPGLGTWVLHKGIETLATWRRTRDTSTFVLSINVSPDQFFQDNFVEDVVAALEQFDVAPQSLKLELTETMFVSEVNELIGKIKKLKEHGVGIALDDFGTGYSSLSYLRQLPLAQLKIDRSFVRATTTERGAAVARNICQMGHDLGLEILAEGIETEEQFRFMTECGCTAFQGYFFGRPLALEAFDAQCLECGKQTADRHIAQCDVEVLASR